ncbi:hypothetical protein DdX_15587 [Ditylenchus destructor]|uniref:Uncharacterized protein n=1 Tax=Ditylenchus destructor TaxID=166010 RepID=A0AAD4MRY2_9BILA|nr:hypothetical protein DdX_15587 [Ditylenchus destructor]
MLIFIFSRIVSKKAYYRQGFYVLYCAVSLVDLYYVAIVGYLTSPYSSYAAGAARMHSSELDIYLEFFSMHSAAGIWEPNGLLKAPAIVPGSKFVRTQRSLSIVLPFFTLTKAMTKFGVANGWFS